jgi:hypothetical protein
MNVDFCALTMHSMLFTLGNLALGYSNYALHKNL